jgi:glutamine synthetase
MTTATEILKQIKDNDVKFVDLRFTDPRGKMQHVTMDVSCVDEDLFADGVMFDGSSIAGWKAINESDMVLMPDTTTAHMDPFFAQSTMAIFCDILDPITGEAYSRDPRTTAKKAEAYLQASGLGDTVYIGPEAEFFIFDDVRYKADPYNTGFKLDLRTADHMDTDYEMGNMGHRPRTKGGYFPVPPIDSCQDMRSEMLTVLAEMGVTVEKHHHEVAAAQHELGMVFDTLTRMADKMQIYKYGVHQVAHAYGKTATFMPKPVFGDNGSGMHVHQSIWKDGKPPSPATSMQAFRKTACSTSAASSSTPRPQRLHQPVDQLLQASGARVTKHRFCWPTRLATVRHPAVFRSAPRRSPSASKSALAIRPPTRTWLLGHADGRHRRHQEQDPPGRGHGQGPLRPAAKELKDIPTVAGSLREALEALDKDREFLTAGGVFDDDQIDAFIELKMEENMRYEMTPHPVEFDMYYSV